MKPISQLFTAALLLFVLQTSGQALTTTFTPATVTAPVGGTVDLQLKVTNFTNISSVQLPITYNGTVLQFTSIDNSALPGFTNGNYNTPFAGKVNVSWFADPGAYPNGFTVSSNTSIFTMHFTVLTNGSTTVNIANVPPGIEVIDKDGNLVTVNYQTGGSNVTAGTGGPPPIQGFAIVANTINIPQGATGCMPVTVNDFTNIISMQYAMHWDKNVLQFQNTQSYNLPDLTAASFGGNPPNGTQLLAWSDPTTSGVTRANGTKIYDVCFKAVGPVGSSSLVTIDGVGFPAGAGGAEAFNTSNQNVWAATSGVTDTIFVVTIPPPPNAVTFTLDKDTVGTGGQTCLDLKVKNFNSIISMQFGICYDATKLQLAPPIQFGPNPLSLSAGGNFNTGVAGEIKFSWSDPAAAGVTLPNDTKIFSVCFNAVAPTGTLVPVTFCSLPNLPIEIVKEPDGPVVPALNNGHVFISNVVPSVNLAIQNACGGPIGSVTANVQNGTATSYAWSGPNGPIGSNQQIINNLAAGDYTVTVTLVGGNTITQTGTVQSSPAIQIPTPQVIISNVKCNGQTNGAISLTVTGGTSPFTYAWSGPGIFSADTEDITGLSPGIYVLTTSDSKGCSFVSQPYTVSQPAILASALVSSQNVACFGTETGQIQISVSGGTPPYTYAWKTVPGGVLVTNMKNPNNLPAGTYNVTVTDPNGCTATLPNPVNITAPNSPLTVATPAQKTDVLCNGYNTGEISLSISGGWNGGTVSWNPQIPGGANPTGIPAGSYVATVTDNGGCSIVLQPIEILQPPAISYGTPVVEHVSCAGQGDGSISIQVSGGNDEPFTILWNGGLAGTFIGNLAGGDYVPTITDSEGCTSVLPAITVNEAPAIQFTDETVTPPTGGPNGSVSLTVTGGVPPYTFKWTNQNGNVVGVTEDIANLSSGDYTLLVTDNAGCSFSKIYEVMGALSATATATASCGNDGCINILIAGGAQPFIITWNGGSYVTNDFTVSICTFAPGIFNLTIADNASNVFNLGAINVPGLQPALVSPTEVDPIQNFANGNITLNPVPSGTPMTYNWNGPNGFISTLNAIANRDSGLYVVTVTNQNSGCTAVYTFHLDRQWPAFNIAAPSVNQPNCNNTADGSITLNITGGNPPYTYAWEGPNGLINNNNKTLDDAIAGTYTCTITDQNGTATTTNVVLTGESQLAVTNVNELSNYGGFQVSGAAECDGIASVAFGGGIGATTILWSNGVVTNLNETLCAGNYSVTVTDGFGCTASWSDALTAPPGIVPQTQIVSTITCHGECDGIARVYISGGIEPYSVIWSTGQIDQLPTSGGFSQAVSLCGGDYRVTITDKLGATQIYTVVVPEPPALVPVFAAVDPRTLNSCDGEFIVSAPPGAKDPITYTWSGSLGHSGTGQRAEGLCAGEIVTFIIQDGNGCTGIGKDTVAYPTDGCYRVRPVLTPGEQDGNNDFTFITCIDAVPNTVEIFNRWGQLVFQTTNYDNASNVWTGTSKDGQPLAEGVYFYVLNYTDPILGAQQQKGHINLLR